MPTVENRMRPAARNGKRRLNRIVALGTLAVLALVVAACGSSDTEGSSTSGDGAATDNLTIVMPDSNIVWAVDAGFGGLEPSMNTQATLIRKPYVQSGGSEALQQDVYNYEGYLAEGYEVSEDGLTYTFKLKDAVSAAGNRLTADDVLWSYERKFATATSVSPPLMAPSITDPASQIKKIDDSTVSFTLPHAGLSATFLALTADLTSYIYDSTLLKQHVTPDDPYAVEWSNAWDSNYGFGPYRVQSHQQGVQTVLEARSDFVLGEPPIKTITLKVVADAGTRANAVKNGDADVAVGILPSDSADLKSDPNVFVPVVDNPNNYLMMPLVTNKPPFDDVEVRRAMAYAVPYDEILENVYRGQGLRQGPSFLLRDAPGYDDSGFPDYRYDPARAKQILTDAGYPDGVDFTLAVGPVDPDSREAAVQIQTFAKEAGFDITIDQQPAAAFNAQRSGHTSQAFILRDYAITLSPPYQLLVYTAPGSTNNFADWEYEPFYDALDAGNALPDALSEEGGKAWNAAERIYLEQSPIVFINQVQPAVVLSSGVTGYAWRSDNWLDYSLFSFKSEG